MYVPKEKVHVGLLLSLIKMRIRYRNVRVINKFNNLLLKL